MHIRKHMYINIIYNIVHTFEYLYIHAYDVYDVHIYKKHVTYMCIKTWMDALLTHSILLNAV